MAIKSKIPFGNFLQPTVLMNGGLVENHIRDISSAPHLMDGR